MFQSHPTKVQLTPRTRNHNKSFHSPVLTLFLCDSIATNKSSFRFGKWGGLAGGFLVWNSVLNQSSGLLQRDGKD